MSILAIVSFIIIFSLLVLLHELGHFWAAKRTGVRVEEFGFGLPPRIWGIKKGETIYSINWIPFGGFVRMKGESAHDDKIAPDAMQSKSYGARILMITGGVLMNFLTAYVLLAIGFWLGMPPLVTDISIYVQDADKISSQVLVLHVDEESPAQAAGVQTGDLILQANGVDLKTVEDLQQVLTGVGAVNLTVKRGDELLELRSTTTLEEGRQIIGVLADELVAEVNYVWWQVPLIAARELGQLLKVIAVAIVGILASLIRTASLPDAIAGPVGIAKITAQVVQLGWLSVLQFMIFLSVNLGLINIVPFPALDGGRLAFLVAEIVRGGKRVKPEIENTIHSLGFLLLLALIFVVTYRDIIRFF